MANTPKNIDSNTKNDSLRFVQDRIDPGNKTARKTPEAILGLPEIR